MVFFSDKPETNLQWKKKHLPVDCFEENDIGDVDEHQRTETTDITVTELPQSQVLVPPDGGRKLVFVLNGASLGFVSARLRHIVNE